MLPSRALELISEYSKPLTRFDWMTFDRAIPTNVFINEIDTLYEFDDNDLFKLVHTNMHAHIDLCLYDMTQEELDSFINVRDHKHNVHKNNVILYKFFYTIIYFVNIYVHTEIGFQITDYFINNKPTNYIKLYNFMYVNIAFGILCSSGHIGGTLVNLIFK